MDNSQSLVLQAKEDTFRMHSLLFGPLEDVLHVGIYACFRKIEGDGGEVLPEPGIDLNAGLCVGTVDVKVWRNWAANIVQIDQNFLRAERREGRHRVRRGGRACYNGASAGKLNEFFAAASIAGAQQLLPLFA